MDDATRDSLNEAFHEEALDLLGELEEVMLELDDRPGDEDDDA